MTDTNKLLELKSLKKKKKPKFLRSDAHKIKRIKKNWRKPKGIDNKIRQSLKGYRRLVRPGFGVPKPVKGLHKSGKNIVRITNIIQLEKVDKNKDILLLSSSIGMKKRLVLLEELKKKELSLLGSDVQKELDKIKTVMDQRKSDKAKASEEKEKKKKEREKKASEKEKKEKTDKKGEGIDGKVEAVSEEEQKKEEKKEIDKVLTKKGGAE